MAARGRNIDWGALMDRPTMYLRCTAKDHAESEMSLAVAGGAMYLWAKDEYLTEYLRSSRAITANPCLCRDFTQ